MRYWPFILAAIFLGLGIYFYPKSVVVPAPPKVTSQPQPPPVIQPTPLAPKPKPSVTLDRSQKYASKASFEWIIFLPPDSGWVNVGQPLVGEPYTDSLYYTPRSNTLWFRTEDWVDSYVIRVGTSKILTPTANLFSFGAEHGDCFPVYIKNISSHDINLTMGIYYYPYEWDLPKCK